MKINKYPFGYKYRNEFENLKELMGFEGVVIYHGIKEGINYLISDSGTLMDLLDPEKDKKIIDEIIKVIQFDDKDEMNKYLEERYGRTMEFPFRAES